MKKVLLAGTALAAAFVATPASAQLELGLAGYFRGYAVYSDDQGAPADPELREFDFRRDTEVHFTGETTLDNGLTVGVHHEVAIGGAADADESYAYFSGTWGRVNFGSEDGAAYLLQVAAPSADSNVDGLRTQIQGVDSAVIEYAHADFEDTDRLTYLTPKFNGFQAGVSYAPEAGQNAVGNNTAVMATSEDPGDFEDLWEAAVRWDGEFNGLGLALGAGISSADVEAAGVALGDNTDDLTTYNFGANLTWNAFTFGGVYLASDTDVSDGVGGEDEVDGDTWVIGAAWDNGPYHVGVSYLDTETEAAAATVSEADRLTIGGGYTFGPGMSFRGAVAIGEADQVVGTAGNEDFTQVTVGTDIEF